MSRSAASDRSGFETAVRGVGCRLPGAAKFVAAAALIFLCNRPAGALEVEQVVWGFDGQVVLEEFNPLSVLVSNPSPEPYDGEIRLSKSLGGTQRIGAIQREPVFLSPGASRWVQFYPFLSDNYSTWTLTWNARGFRRMPIASPRAGDRATVLLDDPRAFTGQGGGLKRLPADLFPPMVTATNGLRSVVLDFVPRWQANRREAFLDWLHRGGIVHLLHQPDGRFPTFPESLAILNGPLEVQRVGAGAIVRHARIRTGLDRPYVESHILHPTIPGTVARGDDSPDEAAANESQASAAESLLDYGEVVLSEGLLANLKRMTRVDHNWVLIHLLSLGYFFIVFPGGYILNSRGWDYRAVFGSLLAAVAVFSLAFYVVGRRGYGEQTAVHSAAVAQSIDGTHYDVIQWSNTFATTGDYYTLTHSGTGRLYSTCEQTEAVNGLIDNGVEGRFLVDIPPYSSRTFAHRTKLAGPALGLKVDSWFAGNRLNRLDLSTGPEFPSDVNDVFVLYRDRFYGMTRVDGRLKLKANLGAVPGFLRLDDYARFRIRAGAWGGGGDRPPEERFQSMLQPLLAHSLGVSSPEEIEAFRLPSDRVRVFVSAPMPPEFFLQDERFGKQEGVVIYSVDLILEQPPASQAEVP